MLLALPLWPAQHPVQLVQLASIPQQVVHALLVQLESLELAEAFLHLARVTFHVQQERELSRVLNRIQSQMKPSAQLARLASGLLPAHLHAQTALRVDMEQDRPINAQVLVRSAPTQPLDLQPVNSVQLESLAQQLGLPLAIVPAMFHVLEESTPYLVQFQICGQMPLFVQTAQQVRLPHLAQQLALHVSQVNGQLQVQQPVQIVLLVALALALQISAQEHAQLAIIQKAASVNARYVQQERLELVEAPPLLARALSHVPLASTRCPEQHPIL